MYCIEFVGHDDLTITFNRKMSVFIRGMMHCTKDMPENTREQCIDLFERMISKLQLTRTDVLWSKTGSNDSVIYSGLRIKLSEIKDDVLNFNVLKYKMNIFMVHLKSHLKMHYKLIDASYINNITKLTYVIF